MFEALQKKSFQKVLVVSIILILAGGALMGFKAQDSFYGIFGYQDFTRLEPDEIKNQLVDVALEANFGCYLEEYEENTDTHAVKTTYYYYVIYTGAPDDVASDYRFMTIKVPARYGKDMDNMATNTYDGIPSSPIKFSGKIKKLNSEEYKYFEEFWRDNEFTENEIEELTLPYYISMVDKTGNNVISFLIFGAGLFLLVWGILRIVRASNGFYLKKLRADITAAGYSAESVESDFASATSFCKKGDIRVGRLFSYVDLNSSVPRAIFNGKILWAYQNTTTHRTNGIKTGTTYSIVFYVDGQKNPFNISVPSEAASQEILQKMSTMFPWIIVGYSEELKKLYSKERAQFMELRYNRVEHIAVEPGFEDIAGRFTEPGQQGM